MCTAAPVPRCNCAQGWDAAGAHSRVDIPIGGAKNAVLPLRTAGMLTDERLVLGTVPSLAEIATMSQLVPQQAQAVVPAQPGRGGTGLQRLNPGVSGRLSGPRLAWITPRASGCGPCPRTVGRRPCCNVGSAKGTRQTLEGARKLRAPRQPVRSPI
jgi:hypothetical protein